MIDNESREWLEKNGYKQYATEPYDKWEKDAKDLDGCEFTLRIRDCSEREKATYGGRYTGKAKLAGGSAFGFGFETFFSDDVAELDKKMQEDINKYGKIGASDC